ncbi:hypothetical protein [Pseudonocardia asaccharolytica]|uniref:Uncharacterized protein n=1 Tax=Pseudonocardia asaccharolytica DSM 44247 = NBRC 16224 TaxID=1123024 RepID=A0A511D194_9PSEU|nr:hypothetical protein [Pseudonocardia asaccharolytica]GEL17314.1 hypothetical protein PA7_11510 [Pseudonocardia asaccharolytica DSM 44247 = NBRC 16224]
MRDAPLPDTPALGAVAPLGRRRVLARAGLLLGLLVLAMLVRATGVLHPDPGPDALPPLPAAAKVVPGLLRAGAPTETDLVLLRDTFAVRGVVVIGAASVEEQAVVPALGMRLLQLDVAEGAAPTAAQVQQLDAFVRSVRAEGPGVVFMHDASGTGPVVVAAAMEQLVAGRPLPEVLAGLSAAELDGLSAAQLQALRDAARAAPAAGSSVSNSTEATR